jgi:DNA-binding PadR family transcriptional regulator
MRTPLESTKYFVLLALAAGPNHGAEIREQVIGDTMGVYLRDSTLYSTLKTLLKDGHVEELPAWDRQRRVCRLSEKGRRALELEARTHGEAARLAQRRLGWR